MPVHYLSVVVIQLIGVHALLFAFRWDGLALALVLQFFVCGLGIDLCYHRRLSHGAFQVPRWLDVFMITCGALALQGDPIEWVCVHRQHHRFADRPGDPHDAGRSLFFAHMGWIRDHYFPSVTQEKLERYCPDLLRDPWCMAIHRYPMAFVLAYFLALYMAWGGEGLRWGVAVRYLIGNNITWGVNSIAHRFGWRGYETDDLSTNCTWLALLSTGGAFHNNHHAFPRSARHGFAWWEPDPGWWILRTLAALGLAWDLQQPSEAERARERPPRTLAQALGVALPDPPDEAGARGAA